MPKRPFSISPNPTYLYITPTLRACIHKIKYTIDNRQGLTAVLGDVGMGKSTILRYLYADYSSRDEVTTNIIPTPKFRSDFAFLQGVCEVFNVPPKRSQALQEKALREFLLAQFAADRLVVLFVDEAQTLKNPMLEMVRTMLNFETNEEKLIQIVVAGQLELGDRLREKGNRAIRRRIFAPSLLDPLTFSETLNMIGFRCQQAEIDNPFSEPSVKAIYELSNGVPGDILRICAIGYELMTQMSERLVTPEIVQVAYKEALLQ